MHSLSLGSTGLIQNKKQIKWKYSKNHYLVSFQIFDSEIVSKIFSEMSPNAVLHLIFYFGLLLDISVASNLAIPNNRPYCMGKEVNVGFY